MKNKNETKYRKQRKLLQALLKGRFNEQRTPVDYPANISKPTTDSEHFLANDHPANDITPIPLKRIDSNRDSVRKAREAYLRNT